MYIIQSTTHSNSRHCLLGSMYCCCTWCTATEQEKWMTVQKTQIQPPIFPSHSCSFLTLGVPMQGWSTQCTISDGPSPPVRMGWEVIGVLIRDQRTQHAEEEQMCGEIAHLLLYSPPNFGSPNVRKRRYAVTNGQDGSGRCVVMNSRLFNKIWRGMCMKCQSICRGILKTWMAISQYG